MAQIKIAILGASGKTGSHILKEALNNNRFEVVGVLVSPNNKNLSQNISTLLNEKIDSKVVITDEINIAIKDAEIIIDFSTPLVTHNLLNLIENQSENKKLIIGTTGLTEETKIKLKEVSKNYIIFHSSNMSIGIGLICEFFQKYNHIINQEYEIIIHDIHHSKKKDSPSGTAIMLRNSLENEKIQIHSSRISDVKGTHEIMMMNEYESVTIKNEISDRRIYAINTLKIGLWLSKVRTNGLYSILEFLKGN